MDKETDPVDACTGYEIIDIECLLHHFESSSQSNLLEKAREWVTAWNNIVCHASVCLHISQGWIRATLLYSPLVNDMAEPQTNQFRKTKAFMDIYALFSLSRQIIPSHVDALGQ